jgi:NADH-quinone oxidoreductase subunit J
MYAVFYLAAAVAIASTFMAITRVHAVHALLYFIVSLLAVSVIFYVLGAPFVAALEVIIYAGAIVVLFVFVVMMLNLGQAAAAQERQWLPRRVWLGPTILAVLLLGELLYLLAASRGHTMSPNIIEPKQVSVALFGSYVIGVELAAMLLLAGLIGAYHLGQRHGSAMQAEDRHDLDSHGTRPVSGGPAVRAGPDGPAGTA